VRETQYGYFIIYIDNEIIISYNTNIYNLVEQENNVF
jgi:hypothetical protein